MFSESMGRLIVEIEPRSAAAFTRVMDNQCLQIGQVSDSGMLSLPGIEPILVSDLADAFNRDAYATGTES
jgi:hypothetical protein